MGPIKALRIHFKQRFALAVHDYYNGKYEAEQLENFIDAEKSVTHSIRLFEKQKEAEEKQKQAAMLKGASKLTRDYIKEAKNELFVLLYQKSEVEKRKPKAAPAIKAKQTRLKNLQTDIDYMEKTIKTLESMQKEKKQKPEIKTSAQKKFVQDIIDVAEEMGLNQEQDEDDNIEDLPEVTEDEKRNTKTAPAIKAKNTRLKNLQTDIEYMEKTIKTAESMQKEKKQKPEAKTKQKKDSKPDIEVQDIIDVAEEMGFIQEQDEDDNIEDLPEVTEDE